MGRESTQTREDLSIPIPGDAELALRAKHDPQAFSMVFERYHRDIYLYCLRRLGNPQDADDASSTVFMKAYAALPKFRPRSEDSGVTFRSWMFSIAHNVIVDAWRKQSTALSLDSTVGSDIAGRVQTHGLSPEQLAIHSDEARTVLILLSQLPENQRKVVELRLAGLSIKEIASALGMSVAATKSNQFRGYQRLREMFEDDGNGLQQQEMTR